MTTHMVSYDLIKRKNYPELIEALQKYNYWHCLGSTWIIVSDKPAMQLTQELIQHVDSDDKLLVTTLSGQAAWTQSFSAECQNWLKTNL